MAELKLLKDNDLCRERIEMDLVYASVQRCT